jgi:TolB protein
MRADDNNSARKIVDHACEPVLSLDGSKFAFYRKDGGLFVWNFRTQSHQQVVLNGHASFATWAPSGERLAYYVEEGVRWIYSVDVDSLDYMTLTPGMRPSWSPEPENDFIAYDSCDGTRCGLFRISPEGTDLRQLTSDGGASVAVSPDGQQIAYRVSAAGTYDIFVIRADGTNPQPITRSAGNDVQPTWSPDGRYIYYLSDQDGQGWAVMEMTANGENRRAVVEIEGCSDLWQHQRISVTWYQEAIHGRQ